MGYTYPITQKKIGYFLYIDDIGKEKSEYVVINIGAPAGYDSSCNGYWLIRRNALPAKPFDASSNDYQNSEIARYLNNEYFRSSRAIYTNAKTVKIPYFSSAGNGYGGVRSGTQGLTTKVFQLSPAELAAVITNNEDPPVLGSILECYRTMLKTCSYDNGTKASVWLRAPVKGSGNAVYTANTEAELGSAVCTANYGYRPCFIVDSTALIDQNNYLVPSNSVPEIISDKSGDLGILINGFTCNYSVDDENGSDVLNASVKLDNKLIESFENVRGQQKTYTLGGEDWLKIANGKHTFKITADDGLDTAELNVEFTRNCTSMSLTLAEPLQSDENNEPIRSCNLKILGNIPDDAEVKYEMCNNALDDEPAWEDASRLVKLGLSYVFKNKNAQNGYAVNFRITAKRGTSNTGGFIEKIVCCYE